MLGGSGRTVLRWETGHLRHLVLTGSNNGELETIKNTGLCFVTQIQHKHVCMCTCAYGRILKLIRVTGCLCVTMLHPNTKKLELIVGAGMLPDDQIGHKSPVQCVILLILKLKQGHIHGRTTLV